MTDHVLVWHPRGPDESPGGDDQPRLIGMPTGLVRPARQVLAADQLTAASAEVMREALAALRGLAEAPDGPTLRIPLDHLDEAGKAAVADMLGEGDVWAKVALHDTYWRVVESVLPGVWRLEAGTADGLVGEWIEVGTVPRPVVQAAAELSRTSIDIPRQMPKGAMNAPSLLAELQTRSADFRPGEPSHVINFTLLPLTEVDAEVLTAVLGQIPLVIRSGGYGSTRVFATGLRNVWAVQYINGLDKVVLDTLEVGGVPVAVLAAREDFEDSAERLAEILEAFAS